ncbi:MAG TPA: hypothetical protein GXX51_05660 [Firmicutes bacterium]|nr:hypothetical protein [Bacillota bacterium]
MDWWRKECKRLEIRERQLHRWGATLEQVEELLEEYGKLRIALEKQNMHWASMIVGMNAEPILYWRMALEDERRKQQEQNPV